MVNKLQSHDPEIEHCPGSKHTNADSLSWIPIAALVSANHEHLFNLISQPSKWGEEPKENQKLLQKWSQDIKVIDGCLYKN